MPPRLKHDVPPRYEVHKELGAEEASRQLKSEICEFLDQSERIITAREEIKSRSEIAISCWANSERKRLGLDDMTFPPEAERMSMEIEHRVREEVRAELKIEGLDSPPRLQIRAAAGLGKTSVVVEELAQRKFWHGRNVEFFVPTTKLAEEIEAKILSKRLAVRVIRGRGSEAPKNSNYPHDRMCAKYKAAKKTAQLGLNVFKTLCKRSGPDGGELVCEFYEDCPYIKQWHDTEPAIRIFAHKYLGLPRPHPDHHGLPEADLVIVDESAFQSLISTCSFGIDGLDVPVRDAVLDHIDNGTDFRQALRTRGITAKFARQRAKELKEKFETDVTPSMPEWEALKLLDKARQLEIHRHAQFWDRIASEIDLDRPFHGIEICEKDRVLVDGKPERQIRIHVHWPLDPVIKPSTPLLMIDADADLEINRVFFGLSLQSVEIKAARNAHVTQCCSTRLSKWTLLRPRPKEKGGRTRELQKVVEIIDSEVQRGGKVLVVMPKQVRTNLIASEGYNGANRIGIIERSELWHGATIAHFHYIRGSDEWADCDTVIIVGREEPPPEVVERIARAIWADDPEPMQFIGSGRYEQRKLGYRMRDGSLKGVMTSIHPDHRVQRVLEFVREKESVQAIDRIRLIHAKNCKRVIILCSIPLDITVDKLSTFDQLAGTPGRLGPLGRLELVLNTTGILPLGPRDLYRAFEGSELNLFSSEDSARDALKIARQLARDIAAVNGGTNQIKYIFDIHPHLHVAEYRRAGQPGRISKVLYDVRRRQNARDILSILLIEPIEYFEDVADVDEDEPSSTQLNKE
jgi:hypothetical protein